jgi:hypothetical protein
MHLSSISPISRISISRCDFLFRDFPRKSRLLPRVLKDGRSSSASGFSPWRFPIPRYDEMTSAGTPNGAFLLSGFRTSQLRNASVSCLQDPRNAEPRLLRISDTRPKWMDGSDQTSGFINCKAKTLTYVSPDDRISDLDDHTTRVLPEIHDCDPFVVSGLKGSRTLGL